VKFCFARLLLFGIFCGFISFANEAHEGEAALPYHQKDEDDDDYLPEHYVRDQLKETDKAAAKYRYKRENPEHQHPYSYDQFNLEKIEGSETDFKITYKGHRSFEVDYCHELHNGPPIFETHFDPSVPVEQRANLLKYDQMIKDIYSLSVELRKLNKRSTEAKALFQTIRKMREEAAALWVASSKDENQKKRREIYVEIGSFKRIHSADERDKILEDFHKLDALGPTDPDKSEFNPIDFESYETAPHTLQSKRATIIETSVVLEADIEIAKENLKLLNTAELNALVPYIQDRISRTEKNITRNEAQLLGVKAAYPSLLKDTSFQEADIKYYKDDLADLNRRLELVQSFAEKAPPSSTVLFFEKEPEDDDGVDPMQTSKLIKQKRYATGLIPPCFTYKIVEDTPFEIHLEKGEKPLPGKWNIFQVDAKRAGMSQARMVKPNIKDIFFREADAPGNVHNRPEGFNVNNFTEQNDREFLDSFKDFLHTLDEERQPHVAAWKESFQKELGSDIKSFIENNLQFENTPQANPTPMELYTGNLYIPENYSKNRYNEGGFTYFGEAAANVLGYNQQATYYNQQAPNANAQDADIQR
jgi:hypothetical protein